VVSALAGVPPSILSVAPAAGAIDVDPATSIVVRFSEPVARASVTTSSLSLTGPDGLVTTTYAFGDADRTVTLTPAQPLTMNRTFTVAGTQAITDVAGIPLTAPLTSSFKTKSPDIVPPRVSAIVPANGAVNVPVGADVEVTFTEPVDRATITAASFSVTIGGSPVAGHFAFANNDALVRFVPEAPLPF